MKHSARHSITIVAVVLLAAVPVFGGKAQDLFQQALVAERSVGDLQKAIGLYGEVVKQAGSDRALAVRALLQIGAAYEKLGKTEAKKAYERVVRDFADQRQAVVAARERLASMGTPEVQAVARSNDPAARRLWDQIPDAEGEVSRDGRYFSYIAWETGDMAIRDLRTGEIRKLTDSGPWGENDEFGGQSRFSPDGKLLAYTWYGSHCQPRCPVELRIVGTDGDSEPRVLVKGGQYRYIEPGRFSPDGKRLLVSTDLKDGLHQLGILTLEDESLEILGAFEGHPHPVEFSPDGEWVLYMNVPQDRSAPGGIFLQPSTGGEPVLIAPGKFSTEAAVGFAPGGDQVIFGSHRSGENALWAIAVRDGRPVGEPRLLRGGFGADHIFGTTSRDLYYGISTRLFDGYIVDLDDDGRPHGNARRVTERVGQDRWPVWNGDGSKIAFVSNQKKYVMRDLASGEERSITSRIRPQPGAPIAWSPDETYFAVSARSMSSSDVKLFLVNAENGEARQIGESEGRGTAFSPDGALLYYAMPLESGFKVMAHELATGVDTGVYESTHKPTTSFITISPDGRTMAVREQENDYRKEDLIVLTDLETGERRDLLREPVKEEGTNIAGFAGMAFTPDGKHLVFGRWERWTPKNQNVQLWRVPLAGGPSEALGVSMPQLRGLKIHPNGEQIAFTAGTSSSELWILENFLPDSLDEVASR